MDVTKFVEERKILSFIIATAALQAIFLLSSFYVLKTKSGTNLALQSPILNTAPSVLPKSEEAPLVREAPPVLENKDQAPQAKPQPEKPKAVTYVIEKGDTLTKIWQKNGGSYQSAIAAANIFKDNEIPLSSLRVGDKIQITPDDAGGIKRFSFRLKDGKTLIITNTPENGLKGRLTEERVEERERVVTGTVLSSFSDAAETSTVPLSVIDEFVDLFSDRVEFRRDLQPGDTFTIIYTQRRLRDGTWLQPGAIRAASLKTGDKFRASVRYVSEDGKGRVFDEAGNPVGSYFLRYPLKFSRISSVFTHARFHPVLGVNRPHNGVDFAAPIGTAVRTVADGVVESAGYFGSSGNMVKIRHNDRYSTAYLHLSKIGSGIRKGARVSRGQVIGSVGMTGLATGPHLHFSLYDNNSYVDPLKTKLPTISESKDLIPPSYLNVVLSNLRHQHEILTMAQADMGSHPRA